MLCPKAFHIVSHLHMFHTWHGEQWRYIFITLYLDSMIYWIDVFSLIFLLFFFSCQHFFGGAMGVFTTRTLLNSVGVSQSRAASGAVAINWILKVKILFPFFIENWWLESSFCDIYRNHVQSNNKAWNIVSKIKNSIFKIYPTISLLLLMPFLQK